MQGAGEPRLLIGSGASPHTYSLKPSDARALQNADVFFWVGEDLETFLIKPLPRCRKRRGLSNSPKRAGHDALRLARERPAGSRMFMPSGGTEREERERARIIPARMVDQTCISGSTPITRARSYARAVAALIEADPDRAELYRSNGEQTRDRLTSLDQALRSELTPLAGRPYIVFHDAYRYLEHRYGLTPVGSITISPERQPSAQRIAAIRTQDRRPAKPPASLASRSSSRRW